MALFFDTPILSSQASSIVEVAKEPDILTGWWTDEKLFGLERRAVFSKLWLCISHRSRFEKPGNYISLEVASFPILLILGKDNIVRAFHNVCRHRAYTVTKKAFGSSLVLGCRYHGWSYDTKGNLVKAPQFDGVAGFDKSQNGLFKIRICTDRAGFIHINLDANDSTSAPDCEELVGSARQNGISTISKWISGFEVEGNFNWKVADYCALKPPAEAASTPLEVFLSYFWKTHNSGPSLFNSQSIQQPPLTIIKFIMNPPIWLHLKVLPISSSRSIMKCDIYTNSPTYSPETSIVEAMEAQCRNFVQLLEDKYLELKGRPLENDPATLLMLKAHLKLERLLGREIMPGSREEGKSAACRKAEQVCHEIEKTANMVNGTSAGGPLDW